MDKTFVNKANQTDSLTTNDSIFSLFVTKLKLFVNNNKYFFLIYLCA